MVPDVNKLSSDRQTDKQTEVNCILKKYIPYVQEYSYRTEKSSHLTSISLIELHSNDKPCENAKRLQ